MDLSEKNNAKLIDIMDLIDEYHANLTLCRSVIGMQIQLQACKVSIADLIEKYHAKLINIMDLIDKYHAKLTHMQSQL